MSRSISKSTSAQTLVAFGVASRLVVTPNHITANVAVDSCSRRSPSAMSSTPSPLINMASNLSLSRSTAPSRPVVITDVLDTLVVDPFFNGMAAYFDYDSFQEFVQAKTPQLWVDFELGIIDESELAANFFKTNQRPPIDLPHFKRFLHDSYSLLPGVDHMLSTLRSFYIDVHVCSNYPLWYELIEQAVGLHSRFGVHWTFVSAHHGIRKPDPLAFTTVAQLAQTTPSSCILLDDRLPNCQAAVQAGYLAAIPFQSAQTSCELLEKILRQHHVPIIF